jgi:hypothetical protein
MFETTRETTTIAASGNANSRYFLAIVHLSCSIGEVLMILSYTKYDQSKWQRQKKIVIDHKSIWYVAFNSPTKWPLRGPWLPHHESAHQLVSPAPMLPTHLLPTGTAWVAPPASRTLENLRENHGFYHVFTIRIHEIMFKNRQNSYWLMTFFLGGEIIMGP